MMLQPIHNQRVLPAKVQQKVLPAVTVDTTEIHKLIDQMYNKTFIMPATHTYEVTHYVQTPQGLVKQPEPINGSSSIVSTQPEAIQQQIVVPSPQLVVPQPQVLVPQTQVLIPQAQVFAPQVQVLAPQPQVIVPQASLFVPPIKPIYSLPVIQRNSLIQPVVPLAQSVLVRPTPQLVTQPLIGQSILAQPISASYNPSML